MHATNTFPVDRHPQYRHYHTTIRSIASGIIIEVEKKNHIKSQILSTINCVKRVGVTFVRCEENFPPCEEEWCTLGV
jgi:hypothetical protein